MSTAEVLTDPMEPFLDRVREDGTELSVSGKNPFFLSDKNAIWYIETGKVEVFTVAVDAEGKAAGARAHYATIGAGSVMFGMDLAKYGLDSGFLAVGKVGTLLWKLSLPNFHSMAVVPALQPVISRLVDGWVETMSVGLTRDIAPRPFFEHGIRPGETIEIGPSEQLRASKDVIWLEVAEGDLLFVGMESLFFSGAKVFFPVTQDSWVGSPSTATSAVTGWATPQVIARPAVWWGLELFHEAVCQCQFLNKKLAAVDEFNRLRSKAEYADEAAELALLDLASVLERDIGDQVGPAIETTDEIDAVFAAADRVGRFLGMEIKRHPAPREKANLEDRIAEIAKASRFRTRRIVLRDGWWKQDQGPVLGVSEGTGSPVALIPSGPGAYRMFDPRTAKTTKVDQEVAQTLKPFGTTFYRRFPDGTIGVSDLLKFGAHGIGRDLIYVGLAGIAIGILGLLIPFATGQIFDAAIPQAEKGMLMQFAIALVAAAAVTTAFRVVQSISVIRLQGKMEYSIQSAVWDRVLNLPMTFFGRYSAGDLADRAAGVSEIRDLLAGAAVSAILGSITGVFYLGMLFGYSLKLALLAVGLTLFFIVVTIGMNVWQLSYQRRLRAISGKITGLVLQLISGVAKIRVSGAENHAFRTWAREFATLRRITFTMRMIQSGVAVFVAGFPIISSMAIFFSLASLQAKGDASLTTGSFIAFSAAYGLFMAAMLALAQASMKLLGIVPTYERFLPIISTPLETDESKQYPGEMTGAIELSHIHFRYDEEGPWILNDVSLKIQPGEFVAFVGGSGSGKSTTMRLMLGFEQPQKGTVYYDGQDLNTLDLREVRQQIGVVLQTSRVLPSDIFHNIVGTTSLTIEDAWNAAEAVGLADDIREMPMGMHTYIAEGGGGFSGGQKQRLLIARAVVHKPKILFLDEATSALDNRTQSIVTESMNKMQSTRIVIAHRLSTIIDADRIVVLEQGEIKEIGSYEELMELDGIFAQLARRQIA